MAAQSFAAEMYSVSKKFGTTQAVDNFSLTVRPGEVRGLLGPNGSGKSTAMKMMMGILKPDGGTITVCGYNVADNPIAVKRVVGYVPESPRLYEFLTGIEYLDFVADMHGLSSETKLQRITEFLSALELEGHENEMISGYSQGMKQKMAIIASLLHRPKVLIFDEPLNGLDPRTARIVKDLIHRLADEGVASIFSTHVLGIAEAICDQVTIMFRGRALAEGQVAELKARAGMRDSTLEDVFLKMTGTGELREIVEELAK